MYDEDEEFWDEGGESALRAGSRDYSCPTCGKTNALTAKDKQLGYQCDTCAESVERGEFT